MKREIFFPSGKYEMCEIIYVDPSDEYLIIKDSKGHEHIAQRGLGTWCAMSLTEIISVLKFRKRNGELWAADYKKLYDKFERLEREKT